MFVAPVGVNSNYSVSEVKPQCIRSRQTTDYQMSNHSASEVKPQIIRSQTTMYQKSNHSVSEVKPQCIKSQTTAHQKSSHSASEVVKPQCIRSRQTQCTRISLLDSHIRHDFPVNPVSLVREYGEAFWLSFNAENH